MGTLVSPTSTPALDHVEGVWIEEGTVYCNFVTSVDGVVAGKEVSPAAISLGAQADRDMMGILRAFADAIVIGAGTLRAEPKHMWLPEFVAPDKAETFRELRMSLGLTSSPKLVVVTSSGDLPPAPALRGSLILTTPDGENAAGRSHPEAEVVGTDGREGVDVRHLLGFLRERGHSRILVEGGPNILGQFVAAGCLDELFLTLSPTLIGGKKERLTLLEGADLEEPVELELLEVRRNSSHLLLRYALRDGGMRRRV